MSGAFQIPDPHAATVASQHTILVSLLVLARLSLLQPRTSPGRSCGGCCSSGGEGVGSSEDSICARGRFFASAAAGVAFSSGQPASSTLRSSNTSLHLYPKLPTMDSEPRSLHFMLSLLPTGPWQASFKVATAHQSRGHRSFTNETWGAAWAAGISPTLKSCSPHCWVPSFCAMPAHVLRTSAT